MGRRSVVRAAPSPGSSGETEPLGAVDAVVPFSRTRRGAHDLAAGSRPALEDLIDQGRRQQADFLRLRWQRDVALGVAAAILVCLVAALFWLARRSQTPAAPVPTPAAPTAPAPTVPHDEDPARADVAGVVEAWAAAWSAQDVETYLSFYAAGFEPAGGISRQTWEARRRERLLAPRIIAITLSDLEIELTGPSSAVASFVQTYVSPGYGDRVRKRLILGREAGSWRILEERSVPQPS